MSIFLIFLFLLILENLLLPALMGPRLFIVSQIFILALIIYGGNWKTVIYKVIPLVLIMEFFSGINWGNITIPVLASAIIYMLLNRYINITTNLRENYSINGLIISILTLAIFSYIYSWFSILFNSSSFNISAALNYWKLFFSSSLLTVLGWSGGISLLFKYMLNPVDSR